MDSVTSYMSAMRAVRKQANIPIPTGYAYSCMEDVVLQKGTLFRSQELTPEELQVVLAAGHRKSFQFRACFENAWRLVSADPTGQLVYCEGFATSRIGLTVHHAWAALNGKVVDPTWTAENVEERHVAHEVRDGVLGVVEPREYCGLLFPVRERVRAHLAKNPENCSLLDDWRRKWPLLRTGVYEQLTSPAPARASRKKAS